MKIGEWEIKSWDFKEESQTISDDLHEQLLEEGLEKYQELWEELAKR